MIMKPDSTLVDRAPSLAQRRRAPQGLAPVPRRAALHRHGVGREGDRLAGATREQGLLPLRHRRGGRHHADGAGGLARLARGRLALGRRDRHQFGLHRHRDPEPRPRPRLSRFPRSADAGRRRALPRHRAAPRHPRRRAFSPTPTWRPGARSIPARSSTGPGSRAAGVGHWVEPAPPDPRCARPDRARRQTAAIAEAQTLLRRYGYDVEVHGRLDERTRIVVQARSSCTSAPSAPTATSMRATLDTLTRLVAALPVPAMG